MKELSYSEKLVCSEIALKICSLFEDILPLQHFSDVKREL